MSIYSCNDRMCGAEDCNRCYPGNHYGETCENCNEGYEECDCGEFEAEVDYEDDDDPCDQDHDDEMADRAADAWENSFWGQG